MPPISRAQATGASCSGNLNPFFSRMKPRPPVSTKARTIFSGVVLRRLLAPAEEELVEALVKQGNDRQHGAGLDDDVEEVALADVQPALGNEQVAGGGNGQELGDSFHNSEQNNDNPVWHRVVRRQKRQKTSRKCQPERSNGVVE